eukprot:g1792.t1
MMELLHVAKEVLAGSVAAATTASIFSPLECIKTRLQIQDLPSEAKVYRHGFFRAIAQVVQEDGPLLAWQHGFAGFVLRDFLYSGLRLGLYPTMRSLFSGDREKTDVLLVEKIMAGASTGALGSAIANPLDVMRVRRTVDSGRIDPGTGRFTTGMRQGLKPTWRSSWHCLTDTFAKEGLVHGLYRGTPATSLRAALLSAGQLASYDHSKTVLVRLNLMEEGASLHVTAAIVSGLIATTLCNPADVLKSRVMLARAGISDHGVACTPFTVAKDIVQREGPGGFMRGWSAAYARAGPTFFIQMPIVEAIRHALGLESI